jgi:hypothetical protein
MGADDGAGIPGILGCGRPRRVVPASLRGTTGRDTVRAFYEFARHPRTEAFRRLARAQPLDMLAAALDHPVSRLRTTDSIPQLYGLSESAHANAMAALGDVARRDLASAEQRLLENARIARELANTPVRYWMWAGRRVQRWVFGPLAQLERLRGNQSRADSLAEFAATNYSRNQPLGGWFSVDGSALGLATDPDDLSQLRAVLTDSRLTPGMRSTLLDTAWPSYCTNAREVAFGPSRQRREALAALASEMRDVPHAAEMFAVVASDWSRGQRGLFKGLWNRAYWCGTVFGYLF